MIDRLSALLCGGMFFTFLLLTGCPNPATTQSGGAAGSSLSSKGEGQDPSSSRDLTGRSSLEAVQQGRAPTTPPSSPLKEIYFAFDRYDLGQDARATLKANADWLKANPSARVEIEGHCDERGTNEYNLALGAKRAQAAKNYLVSLGIAAQRLSTISYGEELPVCKEHNDECWQKNRRARFVIVTARPAS